MQLDYVLLYVADVESVVAWYSDRLGLEADVETPCFARLREDPGVGVAIHEGNPLAAPERVQLEFRVDDIEGTYDRLRAAGVEFDGPPAENPAGFRYVTTADPRPHGRTPDRRRVTPLPETGWLLSLGRSTAIVR